MGILSDSRFVVKKTFYCFCSQGNGNIVKHVLKSIH